MEPFEWEEQEVKNPKALAYLQRKLDQIDHCELIDLLEESKDPDKPYWVWGDPFLKLTKHPTIVKCSKRGQPFREAFMVKVHFEMFLIGPMSPADIYKAR